MDPEDEDFAVVNEAMKYPPKDKMASIGAAAAWNLSEWDEMDRYVSSMDVRPVRFMLGTTIIPM